jgi:hypothetical protein
MANITTCKRCIEGLINVKLKSKGDGTFDVVSECSEMLKDVIFTKELGGPEVNVQQSTKTQICLDAGTHAAKEWEKIYIDPLTGMPRYGITPPPLGSTICLSFGVSMCFSVVTDHDNNQVTATPVEGGYSDTIDAIYDC